MSISIGHYLPGDNQKLPETSKAASEDTTVGRSLVNRTYLPPYKVHVSYVPTKPRLYEVEKLFGPCEVVSSTFSRDKKVKNYKRFYGIVELKTLHDFRLALTRNGFTFCGRKVTVQVSKETVVKLPEHELPCPSTEVGKESFVSKNTDGDCSDKHNKAVSCSPNFSWADDVPPQEGNEFEPCLDKELDNVYGETSEENVNACPRRAYFVSGKLFSPDDLAKVSTRPPFRSFVGNIANWVDEQMLAKFFKPAVVTSITFLYKNDKPKNCATVEFGYVEDFVVALKKNGKTFEKRTMRVEIAGRLNRNQSRNPFATFDENWRKPCEEKKPNDEDKKVEKAPVDLSKVPKRPPFKAYLKNVPHDASEVNVRIFLRPIKNVKVELLTFRGTKKVSAFAEFQSRDDLVQALGKDGEFIFNRDINVSVWKKKLLPVSHPDRDSRYGKVPNCPPFKAFIHNLPYSADDKDLRNYFYLSTIVKIEPHEDEDENFLGDVVAEFESQADLIEALKLRGGFIGRREVKIRPQWTHQPLEIVHREPPFIVDPLKVPNDPPYMAYAGNFPYRACELDVQNFFDPVRVVEHQVFKFEDDSFKGAVILRFESRKDLIQALKRNGGKMGDRTIKVEVHHVKNYERDHFKQPTLQYLPTDKYVPPSLRQRPAMRGKSQKARGRNQEFTKNFGAYKAEKEREKKDMMARDFQGVDGKVSESKGAKGYFDRRNRFSMLPVDE